MSRGQSKKISTENPGLHKSLIGLSYRRPYQCRHTFISICLNSGKLSPVEVAKLVGSSPAMIYKHYLGTSSDIEVPIL
ncbi:MAG: hypothetical protein F6K48_28155 [Okeania sp. SIO3H1]|uniref:hypothetical protein n=1 Tax=Okeania sp. SIO1I7 TaxID=2607772 RepID=UPI0013C816D1|nr:hypothetical protein [Okeania sp. SIO1I7]NEN92561.1 hypothetical protein [Okeania sp. SIO3H1]NET30327.1 hypothetical protein [Okeania sp. SIO1I7]